MPATKKCDMPNCLNFTERGEQFCEIHKPLASDPQFVNKHEGEHMQRGERLKVNNEHSDKPGH